MKIFTVGLSHKTAPISVRDKAVINPENLISALKRLKGSELLSEVCVLSTCNRTEIYGVSDTPETIENNPSIMFDILFPTEKNAFAEHLFYKTGQDSVDHLFKVASGLDSLVLGEPQIFGQLKAAFKAAFSNNFTASILNKLFNKTFAATKRIRTETRINEGPVSVGYAAVELSKKIFGDLSALKILIVGAGETGALTARQFQDRGASKFYISNRTFERAEKLAFEISGTAVRYEKLGTYLQEVDVVVSAIGTDNFIISNEVVEKAMKARKNRSLFFIDLGMPRDIDPLVSKNYNVFLYDIDDLKSIVESNLKSRQGGIDAANELIALEIEDFYNWYNMLDIVPVIKNLQTKFEKLRADEVNANINKMNGADREQVDLLTKSIVKKITKDLIMKLKDNSNTQKGIYYAESIKKLFDLESNIGAEEDDK